MQQLEEGVLAVGAGLAPDQRAGRVAASDAVERHALAVRFHVELLQIGRQARQALVVGDDRAGRITADDAVPVADEAQEQGQVFRRIGRRKCSSIACAPARKREISGPDGDHDRQADGRPERIAPADPIPEAEDALLRDAEGRHLVERGRDRREMRGHRRLAQLLDDPAPRRLGIGHRLDGGEGFRGDDEQRRLRVQGLQRVGDMRAVDIGDVMQPRAVMIGRQRQRRHGRAEIGAADADIDHVGDLAGPHALGKFRHGGQHVVHVRHHIPARDHDGRVRLVAQRRMQHGAVLGDVDDLAREHRVALLATSAAWPSQQQLHGLARHRTFGTIQQQIILRRRKFSKPVTPPQKPCACQTAPVIYGAGLNP